MARFASSCRGRVAPHPLRVVRGSTVILPRRDRRIQRADVMVDHPRSLWPEPVKSPARLHASLIADGDPDAGRLHEIVTGRSSVPLNTKRAKSSAVAGYSPHFSASAVSELAAMDSPYRRGLHGIGQTDRRSHTMKGWGARRIIASGLDVLSMVLSSWRPRVPPLFLADRCCRFTSCSRSGRRNAATHYRSATGSAKPPGRAHPAHRPPARYEEQRPSTHRSRLVSSESRA